MAVLSARLVLPPALANNDGNSWNAALNGSEYRVEPGVTLAWVGPVRLESGHRLVVRRIALSHRLAFRFRAEGGVGTPDCELVLGTSAIS